MELVKRFQREIRAAARLDHPNIVTVHDAGEGDGVMFLVMQYIDGRDFRTLIKEKKRLPVLQAAVYILQVARGLEYMHGEGVIHRDVKPSNLLIDKRGMVKILDMGIARVEETETQSDVDAGRLTMPGEVIGSAEFMSPEQTLDSRGTDARSDIYSLGCTFYYLLVGAPPYPAETTAEKMIAHQEAPIPSLRALRGDVSAEFDALFQKMLAKTPEERHASMSEVIAELEDFVLAETRAARGGGQSSTSVDLPIPSELLSSVQLDATVGSTILPKGIPPRAENGAAETLLVHSPPALGSSEIHVPVGLAVEEEKSDESKTDGGNTEPSAVQETTAFMREPAASPTSAAKESPAESQSPSNRGMWIGIVAGIAVVAIGLAIWLLTR